MKQSIILLGALTGPSEDKAYREWAPEPKAPSNYKNPEVIREYIDAAWEKLELTAGEHPLTGRIARGVLTQVIVDPDLPMVEKKDTVFTDAAGLFAAIVEATAGVVTDLGVLPPTMTLDNPWAGIPPTQLALMPILLGVNARDILRIAAYEYLLANGRLPSPSCWRYPRTFDPRPVVPPGASLEIFCRKMFNLEIDTPENLAAAALRMTALWLGFHRKACTPDHPESVKMVVTRIAGMRLLSDPLGQDSNYSTRGRERHEVGV